MSEENKIIENENADNTVNEEVVPQAEAAETQAAEEPQVTVEPRAEETPQAEEPAVDAAVLESPEQPAAENTDVAPAAQDFNAQNAEYVPAPAKPKKSKLKIIIPIVIVVALVAAILALVFSGVFSKKEQKDPRLLYIKDSTFYVSDKKDFTVATPVGDVDEADSDDYFDLSSVFTLNYSQICGDLLYYCADFEDGACNLYCKDISEEGATVSKVESDIKLAFAVNPTGDALVYVKNDNLYYNTLENKVKIDTDVASWCVDDEFTTVLYNVVDDEEETFTLYRATLGEAIEPEKITNEVSKVLSVSDDLSTIYYIKNNNVYRNVYGGENEKIVSDATSVYFSDEETFYFTKENEKEVLMSAYFEDDYFESDSKMTEPKKEDYQVNYYGYYYTHDSYYDALDDYNIKKNRDSVREMAKEKIDSRSVYYYNGSEEILVCNDVCDFSVTDGGHAVFTAYDASKIEKVKMSDLEYIEDFDPLIADARAATLATFYAHEGKLVDAEVEKATGFYLDGANNTMYFIGDVKTDKNKVEFGTLYSVTFDEEGNETVNELYEDVYEVVLVTADGTPVYFKNVDENGYGDLYEGETEVSVDVDSSSVELIDGTYYILKDCDKDEGCGTLCFGTPGSFTDIAYDVYDFSIDNGNVFYTLNYDENSNTYDLLMYNGTESVEIKKEVSEYTVTTGSVMTESSKTEVFNYFSCLVEALTDMWASAFEDVEYDYDYDYGDAYSA